MSKNGTDSEAPTGDAQNEKSSDASSSSASRPAVKSRPPEELDEFQLLRKIGSGGMGDVYLAQQTSLNRQVAIKIMRSELVTDDNLLQRFKTEAMAAAHLNHSNIVQVYTIGETKGYHYIAQEFVDGWNLKEYLTKKGTVSVALALRIIRQVASALKKAQDAGIVHRDIKPENIMVTRKKGVVKVADFGLARLTLGDQQVNLTQVGMTMGTPSYMSPEQVHGKKVDTRSDIYSLGITCYHILAGEPPFTGDTPLSVVVQHINAKPVPLEEHRPDLPPALCAMVHRMMEKKPESRYENPVDLYADAKKLILATQEGKEGDVQISELQTSGEQSSASSLNSQKKPGRWGSLTSRKTFLFYAIPLLLISAGIGWGVRPKNPLNAPILHASTTPIFPSPQLQLKHAQELVIDQDAWRKVISEFAPERPEVKIAKERLALLLLGEEAYDDAETIFNDFETYRETDKKLYAKGLAGKAIIESLKENYSESNRIISGELKQVNQDLEGDLRRLIPETYRRNNQKLDSISKQELLDLFRTDDELDIEEAM